MTIVQLSAGDEIESRQFTAIAHGERDAHVMQQMLARLRELARSWRAHGLGSNDFLLRAPDPDGHRHWIRVPDCDALLAADDLTAVGFFGAARADIDQLPIHDLEAGIVDTLETVAGVLSYYDLALADGGYGNLILCAAPDAPAHIHGHRLHRRAVELTPLHYHSVRLHTGVVPGAFLGDAEIVIERTRYYDYDCEPPWLAVRELT